MRKNLIIFMMLVICTAILAGCASSEPGASDALVEKIWQLEGLNGKPPIPGTTITVEFREGGKVSGSAGCNSYTTTYKIDGENLTFGNETATTMMNCPEAVMDQENAFLDVLRNSMLYELYDDELVLKDTAGKVLADFRTIDQSITGTSWKVLSYNTGTEAVRSVIVDTKITAHFGKVDQLSGNAGCNDYVSRFETEENRIRINPPVATRQLCTEPEGIMDQETQFLTALEKAATFKISGLDMEMRSEDGALVAVFTRTVVP